MDGGALLEAIADEAASLVILDPQYRGVMDRQRYGNEGARQIERAKLAQMTDETIRRWLHEIVRILRPSGHLILWVDKFMVGEGWAAKNVQLKLVDLITWNKGRIGMGVRSRATCEYLHIAQKPPVRVKGVWHDRGLSDCWYERANRSLHPHQKPINLTRRLIEATTRPGDLIVDPCAGSYVVLDVCKATRRRFVGCDLIG